MSVRYTRWDGTQDPLGDRIDVGDVLDRLGDDMLSGAGGRQALARLREQGWRGQTGLGALRDRVRRLREDLATSMDLEGPFREVSDELDEIVALERDELAGRDDPDARFAEAMLDALPRDPAGRLRELQEHTFASEEAGERFEALVEQLRRDVLDTYLRDLAGAVEQMGPDEIRAMAEMLADLNAMLEARDRGEPIDFDGFMQRHGHLFPEQPQDLDELLEVLARRAMAMQQMLAAMSPEQRAQMAELARTVLDDPELQHQLAQLQGNLAGAMAGLDPDQLRPSGEGDPTGPFSALVDGMERLGELDDLEQSLAGDYAGATLDDVDEDALRRSLGLDAVRDLRRLRRIEQELEQAGVLQARDGELVMTPRGARLLGEKALTALLERVRRQPADHRPGADPEPTGQTRPWRFGATEPLAVQRTLSNAVMRRAGERARGGAGQGADPEGPMRLVPDDLEVVEQEVRPATATALLLDLSFSMPLQGHFVPAKRMALALHALIEGKHRADSLYLVGFSDYARRLQPADLARAGFERVYGTNMQHAFLLARRLLAEDPREVRQVIMVTDGEPTAHLVGDEAVFNWPPVPETLETTLREAMRLARMGISLNIFLLEDAPGLVAFAQRLTQLTGGQVFQMSAEEVGRTVLHDYR
jgi:uncharacterized protein with von Willebrand factor type A (vWA) domain